MTFAPVGIRCPEHANIGAVAASRRSGRCRTSSARRGQFAGAGDDGADRDQRPRLRRSPPSQGGGINLPGGELFSNWALQGPAVSNGDWWRLVDRDVPAREHPPPRASTCSRSTGSGRSSSRRSARRASCSSTSSRASRARRAHSGSARQFAVTVGASGAIFGLIGALLILEYLATGSLMGQAMVLILVNLALTFAVPGISIGGHLGGLAGGIVATYALMRFRIPRAGPRDRDRRRRRRRSCRARVRRVRGYVV